MSARILKLCSSRKWVWHSILGCSLSSLFWAMYGACAWFGLHIPWMVSFMHVLSLFTGCQIRYWPVCFCACFRRPSYFSGAILPALACLVWVWGWLLAGCSLTSLWNAWSLEQHIWRMLCQLLVWTYISYLLAETDSKTCFSCFLIAIPNLLVMCPQGWF